MVPAYVQVCVAINCICLLFNQVLCRYDEHCFLLRFAPFPEFLIALLCLFHQLVISSLFLVENLLVRQWNQPVNFWYPGKFLLSGFFWTVSFWNTRHPRLLESQDIVRKEMLEQHYCNICLPCACLKVYNVAEIPSRCFFSFPIVLDFFKDANLVCIWRQFSVPDIQLWERARCIIFIICFHLFVIHLLV